ncbi:MAG: hypothetical protein ABIF71_09130 [Planctomycetota bacterium]
MRRLVVIILAAAALAAAELPLWERNAAALQEYTAGWFQAAADQWRDAEVAAPEDAVLLFNRGAATYRLGAFKEGAEFFMRAAQAAPDDGLERAAWFNCGNAQTEQARSLAETDLQGAVDLLGTAVAAYRSVLATDPEHADARHNLMVVKVLYKDLLDRLRQKEKEQPGPKNDQPTLPERIAELLKRQMAARVRAAGMDQAPAAAAAASALRAAAGRCADGVRDGNWPGVMAAADDAVGAIKTIGGALAAAGIGSDPAYAPAVQGLAVKAESAGVLLDALKAGANAADGPGCAEKAGRLGQEVEGFTGDLDTLYRRIAEERTGLATEQAALGTDTAAIGTEIDGMLAAAAAGGGAPAPAMPQEQQYLLKDVRALLGEAVRYEGEAVPPLREERYGAAVPAQDEAARKLAEALAKFQNKDQQKQDQNKDQNQQQQQQQQQQPQKQDASIEEVLDKERRDRQMEQQMQRMQAGQVQSEEKDW